MINAVQQITKGIAAGLATGMWVALAFVPVFFVGALLHRKNKRYRAEAAEPFTKLPLRPPGESLRLHILDIGDRYDAEVTLLLLMPFAAIAITALVDSSMRFEVGVVMVVIVISTSIYSGRKVLRSVRELWDYRLGFTGERVVGEELNQLLASGFRVFHDVPFENGGKKFNIDHVLVGSSGVFAIETKTRRKPSDIKGLPKATVYSDAAVLHFPKFDDAKSIPQARINAATLAKWLTDATGERVVVNAVLTIPGWRVERTKAGDVNVLRPDEIKRSFVMPKRPLAPEQIQRIAHELTDRCRLIKEQ